MKRHRLLIFVLGLTVLSAACSGNGTATPAGNGEPIRQQDRDSGPAGGMGPGRGMGRGESMGPDMRERHMAPIPDEYDGLTNPVPATDQSLARGEEIYTTHCATCHGDDGMGTGPAGESLDPAPAPIAHTSQMLGDDYLFWRISEGGSTAPFNSAMPAWKNTLDERQIWDTINYVQALGQEQ